MTTTRFWKPIALALFIGALTLVACGDDDSPAATVAATSADRSQSALTAAPTTAAAFTAGDAVGEPTATTLGPRAREQDDPLGSGGVPLEGLQPIDIGRDIIFRADLVVAVDDVEAAGAEAGTIIQSLGGFLFGQQTTGGNQPRSLLTFKVLPENFQPALDALGSIGEVRSQNVSADDVTDRVVDLESRILTARASVERLRRFLSEATEIQSVVELERELNVRESELESLNGQLRTLENLVAFATIIVTLTEADISPGIEVVVSMYPGHDDSGESCPGQGEFRYEKDDAVTICFELFNTGDTPLTGIELRDTVLDIEFADLTLVRGQPTLLEPGQTLVLAHQIAVERDLRTQTRVSAVPVKEETGEAVPGRKVTRTITAFISVGEPDGIPTFGEGLSAGWKLLRNIGLVAAVVAGAVIPFLWVPVILFGVFVWSRRKRAERKESQPPPTPKKAAPREMKRTDVPPDKSREAGAPEPPPTPDKADPGEPSPPPPPPPPAT